MRWRMILGVVTLAIVGSFALATGAWAAPAQATFGPVLVPNAPLQLCVGAECRPSPPVTFVTLDLSAAGPAEPTAVQPTITPGACPVGSAGVAAQIAGTTADTTITGTLTLGIDGGGSVALPIRQRLAAGAPPLIVKACTGA